MVVSFRAGQFNIGSAGQFMAGGMVAYMFAFYARMGSGGVIFTILIPMLVGMSIA